MVPPCLRPGLLLLSLGACGPVCADDAVVGTGTPASCNEAAFDTALGQLYPGATFPGGTITFACGPSAVTITFTGAKGIGWGTGTVVDGGGRVTLDGGNATRLFHVAGSDSRVELRNLVLERGFALGENGGAIYVSAGNALLIADSLLRDNEATGAGGAVYGEVGVGLVVERSNFVGNHALHGGGMMANDGLTLVDGLFANNDAPAGEGGGLVVYGGTVTVRGTRFENNDATDGGGLLLRGGVADVRNARFENNVASGAGGGIAMYGTQHLAMIDTDFVGNFADQGGGLHLGGVDDGPGTAEPVHANTVDMLRGHIDGNQAREGGGVYVFGVAPFRTGRIGSFLARGTFFVGNHAERGGAIHTQGITEASGIRVQGNTAYDGGGFYLAPNLVYAAGTIQNQTGVTAVGQSLLEANEATHAGGGVYATGAVFQGHYNTLQENYSAYGGGIAYVDAGFVAVGSSSLVRNRATTAGGGLFVDSALSGAYVVETTFSGNQVDPGGRGGHVHVTTDTSVDPAARTTLDIYGSTFVGSAAAVTGNSIHADVSSSVVYRGSLLGHDETHSTACSSGPASSVISGGNNLLVGFACDSGEVGDATVSTRAALLLEGLADNGYGMPSHLPRPGSPAVDHHPCPPMGLGFSGSDQRGLARGVDGNDDGVEWCDAGAIERRLGETSPLFSDGFEANAGED